MKKKLGIKKVTLRDLDDPALAAMAGGTTGATCNEQTCYCPTSKLGTCGICKLSKASCDGTCFGTQCI